MNLAGKDFLLPFLDKGVTQIAWVVKDLDAAVEEFYNCFGVGPWHFYKYGSPLLSMMRRRGQDTSYCMKTAVANAGPTRLELIEPVSGDTIFQEFAEKNGYGKVQHFGIAVDDIEEALQMARDSGFSVTMEGGGYGLDGDGRFAYLDTEDRLGITIELMERPERRHQPYKIFPSE